MLSALNDRKARDIVALDVTALTDLTDEMIIASGTSNTHVRALADSVVEQCRAEGYRAVGVEGEDVGEWVLIDLGDVIVHVMQPATRTFYDLERLWTSVKTPKESAGTQVEPARTRVEPAKAPVEPVKPKPARTRRRVDA